MKLLLPVVTLLACIICDSVRAEELPAKRWHDQAELSFVQTGGNTDVTTLSLKNLLTYRVSRSLSLSWKVEALNSMKSGTQTAERYLTELRGDYLITQRMYGIATTAWLRDRFAGIDAHYDGALGVGYRFLDGPRHTLTGEAGLNYTYEQYINNTSDDYPGSRLFGKYQFAITEKNSVSQSLEYLQDLELIRGQVLHSETALTAALTDLFSLKASYTVRFNSKPVPARLKKTDTTLAMALVATF